MAGDVEMDDMGGSSNSKPSVSGKCQGIRESVFICPSRKWRVLRPTCHASLNATVDHATGNSLDWVRFLTH